MATWATLVVYKGKGGRSLILNESQRGLFSWGDVYYNHQLKQVAPGAIANVVVRLSPKGRRMVQKITVKAEGVQHEK